MKALDESIENILRLTWDNVITIKGTRGAIVENEGLYGFWSTTENDLVIPPEYSKYTIQAPIIIFGDKEYTRLTKTAIYNRFTDKIISTDERVHSTRVRKGLKFVSFQSRRLLIFRMSNGELILDKHSNSITYPIVESYKVAAFIDINGRKSVVLNNGEILDTQEYIEKEYKEAKRFAEIDDLSQCYSSIYLGKYLVMTKEGTVYTLDDYGMITGSVKKTSATGEFIKEKLGWCIK